MHSKWRMSNADHGFYSYGFEATEDGPDNAELQDSMLQEWSPIVWDKGHRIGRNFLFADWCGLDFDGECDPIEKAIDDWSDYAGFIGPTRNHRVEKNGKVADRYRIVVKFDARINDRDVYKYNMTRWTERFGADKQCKDAARYFFPCSKVITLKGTKTLPVLEMPLVDKIALDYKYSKVAFMSVKMKEFLEQGVFGHYGGRNNACYVAACTLRDMGKPIDEAMSRISASPFTRYGFDERELEAAVRSAYRSYV